MLQTLVDFLEETFHRIERGDRAVRPTQIALIIAFLGPWLLGVLALVMGPMKLFH